MAWRLESQRKAFLIQFFYWEGGHPEEAIQIPDPGPRETGTVSPSLALASLSMGSSSALHPQAMSGRRVHLRDFSGYFCGHCQPLGRHIGTHTRRPLRLFLTVGLHAQLLQSGKKNRS